MGKTHCQLIYHAVWSTYRRSPLITPAVEKVLYPCLDNKAKRFQGYLYAAGGIEDHLHCVLSLPPVLSVADILGKLKGSTSYFLNQELQITQCFRWQEGYGVTTVSPRNLQSIIDYVLHQKEHHRHHHLYPEFEDTGEDDDETTAQDKGDHGNLALP